jgi:hypothetical protein
MKPEQLSRIVSYISEFAALLPIVLYVFKHPKCVILNSIFYFLIASLGFDITSTIIASSYKNNLIIINIYALAEFTLGSLIFFHLKVLSAKSAILVNFIFYLVFALNSIFWQRLDSDQNVSSIAESVFFISCSIIFYSRFIKELPVENPWKYAPFWISIGFCFYFTQGLYAFALYKYVFEQLPVQYHFNFWMIHNFSWIIFILLLTRAIYIHSSVKSKAT